ncbi:MAG: ABC transporter permease [Gemmatimonadota bacterium]|nr:MAG: ABC transporter permease [Gemmatimonadota bacterium]
MRRLFSRLGRCLLHIFPRQFRLRYGDEVAEYFRKRSRELRRDGGWLGIVVFWVRGIIDVIRAAIAERVEKRTVDRHTPSRQPRTRVSPLSSLLQDVRYALRTMSRSPGFSITAVVTLALAIGANVAMFSTGYAVLLKPLPFHEPERLVIGRTGHGGGWVSGPDYVDYRDQSDSFTDLGAILPFAMEHTITGGVEPERVAGTAVSTNLFSTLGITPQIGRDFNEAEGRDGAPDVALISHGYWQRRFGGNVGVVGSRLTIDGTPFTVVGVMPQGFRFLPDVEFWRAMRPDRDVANLRDRHNWFLVGRLKAGVSLEQAQSQADVIFKQLEAAYPETNQGKRLVLTELHDMLVADYRTRLHILWAAVGLVLLIACANITGMLLARAPARRVELSTRAALGASGARIVRHILVEVALLSAIGGVLGTVCAVWMQRVILAYMQIDLPGLGRARFSLPLLGLALGAALVVGVVAGLYPALNGARGNLVDDLKAGARTMVGSGTRFRSALTVAQVALSVLLLTGSALLIRSFVNLRAMDPGFFPDNLITAELELAGPRYADASQRIQFYDDLLSEMRGGPGVVSAGMINNLPIRSPRNWFHAFVPDNPEAERSVFLRSAMPGYFETMGIRLQSGRDVEDRDDSDGSPVAVVNSASARAFFGDESPLGQRLTLDFFGSARTVEVVGVVEDVRMGGLNAEPEPALYLSYRQLAYRRMEIAVRAGDQAVATSALRAAVRRLDRDVPIAGIATMEDIIGDSVAERRTIAVSLTLYAALPLLLAAVGLYAVLAYHVSQRSHEISLRMALGAGAAEIARMVLARGAVLIALGVALGVVGAVGLTRLLRQMLFGIEPTDPSTFVGVTLFVIAIAWLACAVPAWRAARVDPMVALQAE